jgi:hypothetical protein
VAGFSSSWLAGEGLQSAAAECLAPACSFPSPQRLTLPCVVPPGAPRLLFDLHDRVPP